MALHRIQVDIDIEASSHEEAVSMVEAFIYHKKRLPPNLLKDLLVLEENEDVCPTCNPDMERPTLWIKDALENKMMEDDSENECDHG
jgi:hypothetical protein